MGTTRARRLMAMPQHQVLDYLAQAERDFELASVQAGQAWHRMDIAKAKIDGAQAELQHRRDRGEDQ